MKFGKSRKETQVPGVPGVAVASGGSSKAKRGRKRDAKAAPAPDATAAVADSAAQPPAEHWTEPSGDPPPPAVVAEEPVVEGEAVELVAEPAAAAPVSEPPVPLTIRQSEPAAVAMPFPVAEQPIGAVESAGVISGGGGPVTSLGDAGEAFASGHAAAPGPSWQQPVMELANERPEVVVGAAFAGGVLAAMILRRLGS